MTQRQRAGLVVIGLVLLLVAVMTGQQTHLVAGSAQAAPVPGPPAVGDCVLDPVDNSTVIPADTATSGGTVPVYTAQQIRSCTTARYGDIAAVIAAPKPTVVEGDADNRYLVDPNPETCRRAADRYIGFSGEPLLRIWQSAVQYSTALSRPSTRQEAAGQHWAACIVTLRPPDSMPTAVNPSPPQYGRSLLDALHTGAQRDQLGSCSRTADWKEGYELPAGGCRQPHALELVAFGYSGDQPVSRAQLQVSCEQVTRQLTAMTDPTAAGALSIHLVVTNNKEGDVITAPQVPAQSSLTCSIATTGTRKLRGSLLALGRQPIPWA